MVSASVDIRQRFNRSRTIRTIATHISMQLSIQPLQSCAVVGHTIPSCTTHTMVQNRSSTNFTSRYKSPGAAVACRRPAQTSKQTHWSIRLYTGALGCFPAHPTPLHKCVSMLMHSTTCVMAQTTRGNAAAQPADCRQQLSWRTPALIMYRHERAVGATPKSHSQSKRATHLTPHKGLQHQPQLQPYFYNLNPFGNKLRSLLSQRS